MDQELAGICACLCFVYRMMVASEKLLECAIDETDGLLRHYFVKHAIEERGHAPMLLDDLKAVRIVPPHFAIAAQLAGAQYYYIAHEHPSMLLGYMAALECNVMPMDELERLETAHGKSLFRTLRHHAEHDVLHGKEVLDQIDQLPIERQRRAIENRRIVSARLATPIEEVMTYAKTLHG